MQRIPALDAATANADIGASLDSVKAKLGMVPNMIETMARAPSVLNGYLAFSGAVGTGELPAKLREQIALVTAHTNGCDYCASAHQALGKNGRPLGRGDCTWLSGRTPKPRQH
jgi:AhpD family alkylhydroperoxidase